MHEIFDSMNLPVVSPRVPERIFHQLRPISTPILASSTCFMYIWFDDHPIQHTPWFMLIESLQLPTIRSREPRFLYGNPVWESEYQERSITLYTIDETRLSAGPGVIPPSVRLTNEWIHHIFDPFLTSFPLYHNYKLNGTLVIQYRDDSVFEYHLNGMYMADVETDFGHMRHDSAITMRTKLMYDQIYSTSRQNLSRAKEDEILRLSTAEVLAPERDQENPVQSRDPDTRDGPVVYDPRDDTGTIIDS